MIKQSKPTGKTVPLVKPAQKQQLEKLQQQLIPGVEHMIHHMMEPEGDGWINPTVTMTRVFAWCNQATVDFQVFDGIPMTLTASPDIYNTLTLTYHNNSPTVLKFTQNPFNSYITARVSGGVIFQNNTVSIPFNCSVLPNASTGLIVGAQVGVGLVDVEHSEVNDSFDLNGKYHNDLVLMTPLELNATKGTNYHLQVSGFNGKVYGDPIFNVGILLKTLTGGQYKLPFTLVPGSSDAYSATFTRPINSISSIPNIVAFAAYVEAGEPTPCYDLSIALSVENEYNAIQLEPTNHINAVLGLQNFSTDFLKLISDSARVKFSQLSTTLTNYTESLHKGGNLTGSNCPPGIAPPYNGYDNVSKFLTKLGDNTNSLMELKKGGHIYFLPQSMDEIEFEDIEPPGYYFLGGKERAKLIFLCKASSVEQTVKLTLKWNVEFLTRSSVNKGVITGPSLIRLRHMIFAYAAHILKDTIHDDNPTHMAAIRRRAKKILKHPMVRTALKELAKAGAGAAMTALAMV